MAPGSTFRDKLKKDGYSKEEKYFYDLNRELIEERQRRRRASTQPVSKPEHQQRAEEPPKTRRARVVRFLKKWLGVRDENPDLF